MMDWTLSTICVLKPLEDGGSLENFNTGFRDAFYEDFTRRLYQLYGAKVPSINRHN
jgi:hypothetical protein